MATRVTFPPHHTKEAVPPAHGHRKQSLWRESIALVTSAKKHGNCGYYPPAMVQWIQRQCEMWKHGMLSDTVKDASDTQHFYEDTVKYRAVDKKQHLPQRRSSTMDPIKAANIPPVFNKRLFASHGNVVITQEARKIMTRNSRGHSARAPRALTKTELLTMKSVVEGLKLIHQGKDYIKECLSQVVSLESYEMYKYVVKKRQEDCLSCYYIVHGAVEVTYDMSVTDTRNVFQPNIIYNHTSGEYLGLVSAEGRGDDMSPPATMYTKDYCELLRIDRTRFHMLVESMLQKLDTEKRLYFERGKSVLSRLPLEVREKIQPKLIRQEYSSNKALVSQDERVDHMFIIRSGHCQAYRQLYIPEVEKNSTFLVADFQEGDMFAEECVLDGAPSRCTVITTTATVCYRLPRSALEIVNKEHLINIIQQHRTEPPSDEMLMNLGYSKSLWNKFKHSEVKSTLKEGGKECLLATRKSDKLLVRPPSTREFYQENIFRFMLKGSEMEPMRARSAIARPKSSASGHVRMRSRAKSAMVMRQRGALENKENEDVVEGEEDDVFPTFDDDRKLSVHMSNTLTEVLDHHRQDLDKLDSQDMPKYLQEHTGFSRAVRSAWVDHQNEEAEEKNFMSNGVLVAMNSDDIVKKAKAIAASTVEKMRHYSASEESDPDDKIWGRSLEAENKQAKLCIAISKYRNTVINNKMRRLKAKKAKEIAKCPRRPKIEVDEVKKNKGFILDKIQLGIIDDKNQNEALRKDPLGMITGALVQSSGWRRKSIDLTQETLEMLDKKHQEESAATPNLNRRKSRSMILPTRGNDFT